MSNTDGTDITVLDALNNYAVVGSYNVMDGGSRAFGAFEQAGIEFDCVGNLWAVNQITQVVYNVSTGENAGCAVDIPWLSENPTEGTIASGGGTAPVTVTFDSLNYLPGLKQAQLQVKTDTPVTVPAIPVTLTVRFLDVPDDNQFQAYIYGIAGAGVMFGGSPVCSDVLHFCPDGVVTRADMAGYLWRALHGRDRAAAGLPEHFLDVTLQRLQLVLHPGHLRRRHHGGLQCASPCSTARTFRSRAPRCRSSCGRTSTATSRRRPARASSTTCRAPTGSRSTTSRVSTTRV